MFPISHVVLVELKCNNAVRDVNNLSLRISKNIDVSSNLKWRDLSILLLID